MGTKWTVEQKLAIDSRGSNLLVSAAAGSGKTAVLIERIIQLILDKDNPIDIDRLLVVTFTNAAASEMRERVGVAIEKELEKNPEDTHLQRQLLLLSKADITTIDSFCGNVLKNNFHVTDLDPNIKVGDPTEINLIASEVMKEVFEKLYQSKDEGFLKIVDLYSKKNNDDALEGLILTLNNFINSSPYPNDWLDNSAEEFNTSSKNDSYYIENYMIPAVEDMSKNINAHALFFEKGFEELAQNELLLDLYNILSECAEELKNIKSKIELFFENKDISSWEELKDSVDKAVKIKSGNTSFRKKDPEAKGIYDEIKSEKDASIKGIREEFNKIDFDIDYIKRENEVLYPYMRAVSNVCKEFRNAFAAKKRSMGLVDFSDIEHYALDILTDRDDEGNIVPSKIAISYREKYEEVFTDEYQDSNSVQELILSMVSRKEVPNRFMVGDVKQSIYRFRQAEPEIFMQKYKSYEEYTDDKDILNKKIMLYKNFRSRKEVLEGCNYVFREIMREETGELDYTEDERLNPSADFKEIELDNAYAGGPIEIHLIDESKEDTIDELSDSEDNEILDLYDEEELEDIKSFRAECVNISDIIYKMVLAEDSENKYMVYDKDKEDYRRVEFKDIVILMRSIKSKATIVEEVLTEAGIPVYSESGGDFFSAFEVEIFMNLLKIIDNPMQDIALISVMRSPIFGFNTVELAKIKVRNKGVSFYEALLNESKNCIKSENQDDESIDKSKSLVGEIEVNRNETVSDTIEIDEDEIKLRSKIDVFIDSIDKYRKKSTIIPIDEFIWYLFKETGYYKYIGMLPLGEQRQNNLMLLFERARKYEKTSYKGLFNFINYVDRIKSRSDDFGEAKLISESANVVRVMSIHKSKGLEFPVVIVANSNKRFNKSSNKSDLLLHQKLGYGPKVVNFEKKVTYDSLSRKIIKNRETNESLAEEMRLLYVAMTRAKEKLIFTGTVKDYEKSEENWKGVRRNLDGNLDSVAILSTKSYLDWIMPTIINMSPRESTLDVRQEEKKYIGYKDCKWIIDTRSKQSAYINYKKACFKNSIMEESLEEKILELDNIDSSDIEDIDLDENQENKEKIYFEKISNLLNDKFDSKYKYESTAFKPSSISVSEVKKLISDEEEEQMHENLYSSKNTSQLKIPEFMHSKVEKMEFNSAEKGSIFHLVMQLIEFDKFEGLLQMGDTDAPKKESIVETQKEEKTDTYKKENAKIYDEDSYIKKEIRNQIENLVKKNILSEEEASTVNTYWIFRFIKSPIFREILKSNRKNKLYKEKAINYSVNINSIYKNEGIRDGERLMLVGIVDLFFEDDKGDIVLLDYKTDFVNDENFNEVVSKYDIQLELYKKALEEISGKRVSKKYIYLFNRSKLVEYE
ncbi:helicase-exonuclease AddAB subunit AddA [Peptostreptococcus faecalis]|uniref:helicase-exonuclease AddAB subunit AddA n=1 Tax=Peptostreptococcus faecalis TaxID=2045015 RepID=UPI000C7C0C08|nr:helicase-exonuclease AddAB subunit AddA [Peptostreptococcus faecalis]